MARVLRALFGVWLILLLGATYGWAQATAQINGTVTGSTGSVLPGTTVVAIQTDTGFRREAVTDGTGSYTLLNLPLGPYRLEVSLSGFRTYTQTGIVLQVNSNPVIPVTLQLGGLEETVLVEAAAPLVDTRNTAIGSEQYWGKRAANLRCVRGARAGLITVCVPSTSHAPSNVVYRLVEHRTFRIGSGQRRRAVTSDGATGGAK